jgi:hypothetical protein
MATQSNPAAADRIRVGDTVEFHLATNRVRGRVVEDRGPLGVGGRRVYRVEVVFDPESTLSYELPADLLERVSE